MSSSQIVDFLGIQTLLYDVYTAITLIGIDTAFKIFLILSGTRYKNLNVTKVTTYKYYAMRIYKIKNGFTE